MIIIIVLFVTSLSLSLPPTHPLSLSASNRGCKVWAEQHQDRKVGANVSRSTQECRSGDAVLSGIDFAL